MSTVSPTPPPVLREFGPSIWSIDGPVVNFMGAPYSTRMVIIQLDDGNVWAWSPVKLTPELREVLKDKKLDAVKYIVSPNKIHHIFLEEWQDAFPDAKIYAPPGLSNRNVVKDVTFHGTIDDNNEMPYSKEIRQVLFKGSCFMEEAAFYHPKSETAIIADLVQRFPESTADTFMGKLMKIDGVVGLEGSTPRDFRLRRLAKHAM